MPDQWESTSDHLAAPGSPAATGGMPDPSTADSGWDSTANHVTTPGVGAHISAFLNGLKTAPLLHPIDSIGSIISMARHPIDTAESVVKGFDTSQDRASAAWKSGQYAPAVIHEGLAFLPLIGPAIDQHYQEMKDAEARGDTVGQAEAAGKLIGIGASAELARRAPDIIAAAPKVASDAGTAIAGAAKGAFQTAGDIRYKDMIVPGAIGEMIPGVGWKAGAAIGIGLKFGKGAVEGALSDLAAKRATAAATEAAHAEALAAANKAAEDAAATIKGASVSTGEAAAPSAPEMQPVPPERQLPPAGKPPIIAGPARTIAGGADTIDYVPPSIPAESSGPIPTDPVTGRPLDMGPAPTPRAPAAPAATTPSGQPELISLDDIARGMGPNVKRFADLTDQQKRMAQQVYDEIHAGPTYVKPAEPAPEPTSSATSQPPGASPDVPRETEPTTQNAPSNEGDKGAVEEPVSPLAVRSITVPATKNFPTTKIVSEEGLRQYANDTGLSEDQARQQLESEGHTVLGRSQLNTRLHDIGGELGMGHDQLSDVAKIQFGIGSMTQMSQEDMVQLLDDLNNKRAIAPPVKGKGELTQQFRAEQVSPPRISRLGDFGEQLRQSLEASKAKETGAITPVATAAPEATPAVEAPSAPKSFPLVNVGDTVQLRSGRYVKVKALKPDGTIVY